MDHFLMVAEDLHIIVVVYHLFEVVCYSNIVSPIDVFLQERNFLRYCLGLVEVGIRIIIVLYPHS